MNAQLEQVIRYPALRVWAAQLRDATLREDVRLWCKVLITLLDSPFEVNVSTKAITDKLLSMGFCPPGFNV